MSKNKKGRGAVAHKEKEVKELKKQELIHSLNGMQLLGEIITWNARSEDTFRHKDVVEGLEGAGLDPKIARELLPRFAFTRACKKLSDEAVIDVVKDGADTIKFQFTKKTMQNEEWKFSKDTELTLDKKSGKVSCPKSDLEQVAQRLLDEAMDVRTTSDITKIVQKLFDKNGDLFPIREQGGVYFVPNEHCHFIEKIELFLNRLGGKVTRFPVPAGTQHGDAAVATSVAEALNDLISEHEAAIDQFTINTRQDTTQHQAEKIKETKVKIEAYAHYLQDKSKDLLDAVAAAQQKLLDKVNQLTVDKANAPQGASEIYGHSVTAVIRWMGKSDWEFKDARKALLAHNVSVADATIRAQLHAGRKGERGEPANINKKQEKELVALARA